MALMNFSLPFSGSVAPSANWLTTPNPLQHHAAAASNLAVNDLLYSPEGHQAVDAAAPNQRNQYYKNDPYSPPSYSQPSQQYHHQHQQQQQQPLPQPQQHQQQQHQTFHYRSRATNNNYLPPPSSHAERPPTAESQHIPQLQPPLPEPNQHIRTITNYQSHHTTRGYGESRYEAHEFFNENFSSNFNNSNIVSQPPPPPPPPSAPRTPSAVYGPIPITPHPPIATTNQHLTAAAAEEEVAAAGSDDKSQQQQFPIQRPTYTQVQAGHGTKTQVHAVLDYDNDDYYDESGDSNTSLTPIQGPIFIKNGSVPVVPLLSYPTMNNGTFIRIPIWWTALSVALGLEVRGEVIRGTPCVKRHNQLFCPTAGNSYPIERIEEFIDENKALMRRMYGDFRSQQFQEPPRPTRRKRSTSQQQQFDDHHLPGIPDITAPFNKKLDLFIADDDTISGGAGGDSYFGQMRKKRQSKPNKSNQRDSNSSRPSANPNPSTESSSGRVDACESKIEIVTPYWASNSAGKIRAIVNTQHFEQAIHQEVCTKMNTSRCGGDCGCEQKYKWHRLLSYDPDNDCKGIFMDWFLFPSCCVCRCNP